MGDHELKKNILTVKDIVCGYTGKPVIKGTRLSVEYILNLLGHGATVDDILLEYRGLVPEDIHACLLFAAKTLSPMTVIPLMEAA